MKQNLIKKSKENRSLITIEVGKQEILQVKKSYYPTCSETDFDEVIFIDCITSLESFATEIYKKLYFQSIGRVPERSRNYYRMLFEKALAALDGVNNEEGIIYGSNHIMEAISENESLFDEDE